MREYEEAARKAGERMDGADACFVARIMKGFAENLLAVPGRAVQVFGAADALAGLVQFRLKSSRRSFLVLLPIEPGYSMPG